MSLFGRAPAPAPIAAPAGVLSNTLDVELLHPVACENRKNGSGCEKVKQAEPQKTSSAYSNSVSTGLSYCTIATQSKMVFVVTDNIYTISKANNDFMVRQSEF